jgi:hypothetical protein
MPIYISLPMIWWTRPPGVMAPSATASARRVEIGLTAFCNGPNPPHENYKTAQVVGNRYSWLFGDDLQ